MRKHDPKKRAFFLWVLFLAVAVWGRLPCAWAEEYPLSKLFGEANMAYKQNQYDEAVAKYQQIRKQGLESGPLYYNLGNGYLKKGELGRAVLYYERAMQFIPRDSDLRSNYDYALVSLGLSRQEMPGNRMFKGLDRVFEGLSLDGLTGFLSFLYILGLIVFLRKPSRIILFVLMFIFILAAVSLARKIDRLKTGGVIIEKQAEAKFEPSEGGTTFFKLSEGSLVKILESSGEWCKVKRPDNKLGWTRASNIERIED
jgi:tetratricopeptide (TPR) repeat protein